MTNVADMTKAEILEVWKGFVRNMSDQGAVVPFAHEIESRVRSELLDRLELAESRQATYRKAFEISENTTRDLTEKVIPNIREQLEAAEKELESWKGLAQQFGNEADALRAEIDKLNVQNSTMLKALLAIADWNSAWGPFPENNEHWRAMAVVTAREVTKALEQGDQK